MIDPRLAEILIPTTAFDRTRAAIFLVFGFLELFDIMTPEFSVFWPVTLIFSIAIVMLSYLFLPKELAWQRPS